MPPDPPSIPSSPDSADRLLDEMMLFLRGGPVPDPPEAADAPADPPSDRPGTASWDAGGETADPSGRSTPAPAGGDTDPGRVIGPYRIIADVDRGGMGEVFQARHQDLGRVVALKTIRAGLDGREGMRQRFRTEAAAVARLDHPHIVRLYDFDEDAGQLYYAMEWAPGGNLARRIRTGALPAREAAGLVRDLARAMAFAHDKNVLHRDLKPNNVLLAADGMVKVADFGLARLLDDPTTRLTADDAVLGTPAYMAPEQAAGRVDDVDARTDVYALGAILYEAVTGSPPFTGRTNLEVLDRVKRESPARPSSLTPGLSADLEVVCLRCLEKDRADRYQSADALAADLDRFLASEPLVDKPWTRVRKVVRAVRKRRAELAVGLAVIAVVAGAVLAFVFRAPTEPVRPTIDRTALEAALDAGGRVELLGEKGRPKYGWGVRQAGHTTSVAVAPDGAFTVVSGDTAVIELVPDPRRDSFVLRAQLRHLQSDVSGEVGVYVADRGFAGPGGADYGWRLAFTMTDWYTKADVTSMTAPTGVRLAAAANERRLRFDLLTRGESRPGLMWWWRKNLHHSPPYTPNKAAAGWRTLEMEVTPGSVRTRFADAADRWSATTASEIEEAAAECKKQSASGEPDPCWDRFDTRYNPRGAVGLHIRRGTVTFRNVEILPLPTP